jgi:uncharacterized membrane protein
MAPLIALLLTFGVARVALRKHPDPSLPGRVALSAMLGVTAAAHFVSPEALAAMVPPQLPAPMAIVYATGVAEVAFAIMLVLPATATPALGWVLVAFFVAVLPANIYSAIHEVGLGGHGAGYLWFRVPLQLLFIGWAATFTGAIRRHRRHGPAQDPPATREGSAGRGATGASRAL